MSEQPEERQEALKRCFSCVFSRTIHRYNASTGKWECTECEKKEQLKKDLEQKQEQFKKELEQKQEEFKKRHSKNTD